MSGSEALEREWWLRTLRVLYSPAEVFAALSDDSDEAASARQEPMLAIVILGGIAAVLVTGAAGGLLDRHDYDGLLIAVWAFIAGGIYGFATYWLGGAAVHLGQRGAGGKGSYRQARHLLGFAATPIVVWLVVVWPVRLALYGEDLFRTGGSDGHASRVVFGAVGALFLLWCSGLLLVGFRAAFAWDWRRSVVAFSLAVAAFGLLAAAAALVLRGS